MAAFPSLNCLTRKLRWFALKAGVGLLDIIAMLTSCAALAGGAKLITRACECKAMDCSRWFGLLILIVLWFDFGSKQTATFQRVEFHKILLNDSFLQIKYNDFGSFDFIYLIPCLLSTDLKLLNGMTSP